MGRAGRRQVRCSLHKCSRWQEGQNPLVRNRSFTLTEPAHSNRTSESGSQPVMMNTLLKSPATKLMKALLLTLTRLGVASALVTLGCAPTSGATLLGIEGTHFT